MSQPDLLYSKQWEIVLFFNRHYLVYNLFLVLIQLLHNLITEVKILFKDALCLILNPVLALLYRDVR